LLFSHYKLKLFLSGTNPQASHYEDLNKSSKYLTYYTTLKEDNAYKLSIDAKQILNLRINPSNREFSNQRFA
jgi:hypothetical protein